MSPAPRSDAGTRAARGAPGEIVALLLAGGRARRFGANKLAHPLADGMPVGLRAAAAIAGAVDELVVVVRSGDAATSALFEAAGYTVLACPDASLGMAHSLAHGVRARPRAAAWLVALADMPWLAATTVARLVAAWRRHDAIVVPRFRGRPGHPVIFPARYRRELEALRGDVGARQLLERHRAEVHWCACGDAGILRDVDEPADLGAPGDASQRRR